MTEQEKLNSKVKRKIAVQNANIQALTEELRDFKNEVRQQNKMRAEEIATLRADTNAQIAGIRAEIAEIRNTADSIGKHVNNMTIAVAVGVGAMVLTVIFSVIFK